MTLMFFLTPILYRLDFFAGQYRLMAWVVRLNPFTPFTLAYQDVLFFGQAPPTLLWVQMGMVSVVFWTAGSWLFDRLRETLVEAA
jgi:ABC-type polysaccharide/polyol phosphate export permease